MRLLILSIFTLILFPNVFAQDEKQKFDYGKIENNQYINDFFNISVDIPEDWFIQNEEQIKEMQKMGRELVVGDNEQLNAAIKVSEINTANLLSVNKYELGAPVDFNPSFGLIAENLSHAPGVKKGSDYLFQVRRLLEQSKIEYNQLDKKFKKTIISGHEFYILNSEIDYMGTIIKQSYYTTIKNKFAVSFVITFSDKKQRKELMEVVNSLEIKQ